MLFRSTKVGSRFDREERYQQLVRRQNEIEEKLDLTKNQASSQAEGDLSEIEEQKTSQLQKQSQSIRPKKSATLKV